MSAPKARPWRSQDLDHLAVGHVVRAVEGHVLQEVGQALLGVALLQRAGVEAQAQRRLAAGRGVLHDHIAHAVGQRRRSAWPDRAAGRHRSAARRSPAARRACGRGAWPARRGPAQAPSGCAGQSAASREDESCGMGLGRGRKRRGQASPRLMAHGKAQKRPAGESPPRRSRSAAMLSRRTLSRRRAGLHVEGGAVADRRGHAGDRAAGPVIVVLEVA